VKVHGVFPSSHKDFASSRRFQFHWVNIGDSKAVVTPFMQDGTYPPRDFATFGPSELRPPLPADSLWSFNTSPITYTTLGRCQTQYISSSLWQSLVFLLNSRCFLFTELIPFHIQPYPSIEYGDIQKSLILFFPKLQSNFAEFLQYSFLIHLSIFYLSTCVSNRYGQIHQYNFPECLTYYIKINYSYNG